MENMSGRIQNPQKKCKVKHKIYTLSLVYNITKSLIYAFTYMIVKHNKTDK